MNNEIITIINEQVYSQSYVIEENTQFFYRVHINSDVIAKDIELSFHIERNATLRLEILIVHVSVSVTIMCTMNGESSNAIIHGAYILNKCNNVTIKTVQNHKIAHATSNVVIKGVLHDNAQALYSGMIRVEKNAYFTVALQENKNIILNDNARALSIPQLEVLNNDVQCFHGSAVGKFDQDQIFYCIARGIDIKNAERLLLQGFFAGLFENVEMNKLLEKFV